MLDFGGWLDGWDWSGAITSDAPRWLQRAAIPAGVAGLIGVATCWLEIGVGWSAWMLLVPGAVALEVACAAPYGLESAIVPWSHTLLFAGLLALLAFFVPDPHARRAFALIAPCLALGSAPLLTRIWSATLFAGGMITFSEERREHVRAAIAGESDALVVRVTKLDGSDVELVTLGKNREQLRASADTIYRRPFLSIGNHFSLERPELGELESPDGYRRVASVRRVRAVAKVRWLGKNPEGLPASAYAGEVRAGVVVMMLHHAIVAAASFVLAAL